MRLKTLLSRLLLVAIGLLAGTSMVNAESTVIYGRALTADAANGYTAWSESDVATTGTSQNVWIGSFTIDATNGLYASATGARSSVLTFSHTANSIQTIDLVFNNTVNTGNASNYSYLKIGSDIEIQSNQQNQNGTVIINGTSSSISNANGKNNGNRQDVWTIHLEINTATNTLNALTITGEKGTKKASYTLSTATALSSSATYNTVTIGFTRSGGTPSAGLLSIKIAEEEQNLETADYTINYKNGTETVKTVTGNAAVSAVISAETVITGDDEVKYLTTAVEAPNITIVSDATKNVLEVPVRKPYTATLTVTTTVNGTSTTAEPVTLTETDEKDCSWSYAYPMYEKSGDVYYACDATSYVISGTFSDGEAITKTVTYSTADETVMGFSEVGADGKESKYSGGTYTSVNTPLANCTLSKGSYQAEIYVVSKAGSGKNGRNENVKVGGETVATTTTNATGLQTLIFSVSADDTEAYVQGAGTSNYSDNLDYALIRKIADPTVTINADSKLASYSNDNVVTVPDDVTIYIATANDGSTVTLTKVDGQVIPAKTGVILYSTTTGARTLSYGGTAPTISSNLLTGTGSSTFTADDNTYALVAGEQAIAKVNSGVEIPANKAYLTASTTAKLNIVFDGTVTGINSVEADGHEGRALQSIYNLAGQRVSKSYKGVVVKGGKKFLQR